MAEIDYEFYRTPAFFTEWLCDEMGPHFHGTTILEPCVGDGAMTKVLAARIEGGLLLTNDLDPQWSAHTHEDASSPAYWGAFLPGQIDWVVTNPAFKIGPEVLARAWPCVTRGIVLHVRISFHEPAKTPGLRRSLLRDVSPDHALWLPRVRFKPNKTGTDQTSTCWLVWSKMGPLLSRPNLYAPESIIDAASAYRP